MEYRKPYTRYEYLESFNRAKHQPYDYKKNGLLNKMLSPAITQTQNKTTRLILEFVESVVTFWMDYVDELKNFKNWSYRKY